jgi:hypothetical protein
VSDELRAHSDDHTSTATGGGRPPIPATSNVQFPDGFEEDDHLRSEFIRQLAHRSLRSQRHARVGGKASIPPTLVRFWHDSQRIPADVQACLDSWAPLRDEGVTFRMFDDVAATTYIADRYAPSHVAAFARCEHPAMRSDYLRLCFVLAEGGLYVDADDMLLNDGWRRVFRDDRLKVQPLCYDVPDGTMVAPTEAGLFDLPTPHRIFYINNNPIAAPPGHPVLQHALDRATRMLLDRTRVAEIQSTTGPGNLTAALAAHAHKNPFAARHPGFDLLFDWESTAQPDWTLGYRHDNRNWRNWAFTRADRPTGDK